MPQVQSSTQLYVSAIESLATQWRIPASDAAAALISAAESRDLTVADLAALVCAAADQRRLTETVATRRTDAGRRCVVAVAS